MRGKGRVVVAGWRVRHLSEEDIVAYADGGAEEQRRDASALHLDGCPLCRQRVVDFRAVGQLLRASYPLVDDPGARARIISLTSGAADAPFGRGTGGAGMDPPAEFPRRERRGVEKSG